MTDVQELLRGLVREHGPHCFRAHGPGQGYVNDGSNPETREDYDRQYRQAAESEIENMTYAPGYAEPGCTQPANGVLLANWNNLPSEVIQALENEGYAIEWEDEWIECDDCRRTFRSQPDSYFWRMSGQVFEHDRACLSLCRDCLQEFAQQQRDGEIEDAAAAAEDAARSAAAIAAAAEDGVTIGTRVQVRTSLPGDTRQTFDLGTVTAIGSHYRSQVVYTVLTDSGDTWHISDHVQVIK